MIALLFEISVQLWNAKEGVLLQTFNGRFYEIIDVVFSPNGQMVASASQDRTIRLWYISGEPVRTLKDHLAEVKFFYSRRIARLLLKLFRQNS